MFFDRRHDARIRAATFEWLSEQVAHHGDVLPRAVIAQGPEADGERVPLVGPQGIFKPWVSNGLSLCRLHYAAFDRHFVGLRPDLTLEVRPEILREEDGPTLVHGIQSLEGQAIRLARRAEDRPDQELLSARYRTFRDEVVRVG